MRWLVPDFETVSACDLKTAGAWRYSLDFSTQVLCLSWEWDDGVRGSWTPLQHPTTPHRHYGTCPEDIAIAIQMGVVFVAHNAGFEKAIWTNIMVKQFGWPEIPPEQWADSMARCAELALPQKLERAASVLHLPFQKDTAASKRTVALSNRANWSKPITKAMLDDAVAYNVSDVDAQKALHKRVGWLTPGERRVWDLDQRINGRGVEIDLKLVDAMQSVLADAAAPLETEFRQLTGYNVSQNKKVLEWVNDQGVPLRSLGKEIVTELIDQGSWIEWGNASDDAQEHTLIKLPDHVLRALQIRSLIGSASVKKLNAMRRCVAMDGRAYGLLAYHAASTGRWAGRLLQPQNFPRGTNEVLGLSVEQKLGMIYGRELELMAALFGSAYELVIGSLRHVLKAKDGYAFVAGDFAQIEARIVLSLAGQYDKVDMLATGADPYCDLASQIFGRPITKKDTAERQTGKNGVLGLGFQMGWPKFQARYAKDQSDNFCEKVVATYRREWAPEVPRLWYDLDEAAVRAGRDGLGEARGVEFRREDVWMTARLPSGRKLWYPMASFNPKHHLPWSTPEAPAMRPVVNYYAWKLGQWRKQTMYGGLLTENVVQALARDLLVEAMFKCEEEGIPVVLTVHDEIVAEVPVDKADHRVLEQIMSDMPDWARALKVPVKAEGWTGERYKK